MKKGLSVIKRILYALFMFTWLIYLLFIGTLGGISLAEFIVFCLKEENIIQIPEKHLTTEFFMLFGLLLALPIFGYIIIFCIRKDKDKGKKV
ncbi:MAG: hypothetical protein ACYSOF_10495 [Planctomycetota bacterium]|jgi:hypothetical protein